MPKKWESILINMGKMLFISSFKINYLDMQNQQLNLNFCNHLNFSTHQFWLSWLNDKLSKPELSSKAPVVLDLFAGCGGLALGFEAAGFLTYGFEMKPQAVATYNKNLEGICQEVFLSIGLPEKEADIIIGGPPCQPFSQIGYQRGKLDSRDGFPIFLDAVNRIRPKITIVENYFSVIKIICDR